MSILDMHLQFIAGRSFLATDAVQILRDGKKAFPAMLELIEGAENQVLFENFIFAGDATGKRFAVALSKVASRGLEVKVLYDPIGTMMLKGGSIASILEKDGVNIKPFRPVSLFIPLELEKITAP